MVNVNRPEPRFDWFIPLDGDGSHIGTMQAERPPTFEYLREVAEAAQNLGYYSLLVPTRFANGLFDENAPIAETWTTVTALAATVSQIKFLVAVRPGFIATGLFAQMAATLAQISQGRVDINVVPGGIPGDFERMGDEADHTQRYQRAEEFIVACRKLWATTGPVSFQGKYVKLKDAICPIEPLMAPKLYMGGASDKALSIAARHADVYLSWILPKDILGAHFDKARTHFAAAGRVPVFGLRTHVIMRDSEEEAWSAATKLLSRATSVVKQQRKQSFPPHLSIGRRACSGSDRSHQIGPHLWNGISTVRVNCGTAIVGTPRQVADELQAYWRLGVDEFILSGYPHVEECERISADLLPLLRSRIDRELTM